MHKGKEEMKVILG